MLCVLIGGIVWFSGEYQYYKNMYERGKITGVVFEDCKHTSRYLLDQSSSMATRNPVALSSKELQKIHPTVLTYMWCCGQVQDEVLVWSICAGGCVVYTIIVAIIEKKKQQSVL